jgi:hypothetical protein
MLRIFLWQRGQRLPANRRKAQTIKETQPTQKTPVKSGEWYLLDSAAPPQKIRNATKLPICNTTCRVLNESYAVMRVYI